MPSGLLNVTRNT